MGSKEYIFDNLLYAVSTGNLDEITRCIKNGAEINKQDKGGYTPLMLAARMGMEESVELLLNNGADPWILDNSGKTAAGIARDAGFERIADIIEEHANSIGDYDIPESVKEAAIDAFVEEKAEEIRKKLKRLKAGDVADEDLVREANNLNLMLSVEAHELSGWLDGDTVNRIDGCLRELNDLFEETAKEIGRPLNRIKIGNSAGYSLSPVFKADSKLLKDITKSIYSSMISFASEQLGIPPGRILIEYEEYHERLLKIRKALLDSARDENRGENDPVHKLEEFAYAIGDR